jgi:hypothetical protein
MASKWAKLKGKFDKTPLGKMSDAKDASFVQLVDQAKLEYGSLNQDELQREFVEQDLAKDAAKSAERAANARLEALGQLLIARFEEQQVNSVKTDLGKTFTINVEPYVSYESKEEFEKYIVEHPELEYMYTINPQSLSSYVKDLLEQGKDSEIPSCLKVYLKTQMRIRNS